MVDSPKRLPVAFLGNDYNNFLFASFGADRIGGQLSVVSALARLDMDPWDEAEKLARLSGDSAVQKLLIWMSRLPELSSGFDEPRYPPYYQPCYQPWQRSFYWL
ncbi:MAG: hypothetical protein B7Z77_00365 [Acidocella sp. 20-58-15]|nr:MAG: hypothetical protein B7Z77_00365 [Acidocella sp. 20-58-15]